MRPPLGWFALSATVVAAVVVGPGPRASGGERSAPAPVVADDRESVQDVIFLGDARPVFVRLRLDSGGRGFRKAWRDSVRALHAYLDRDGDGTLTKSEAERGALATLARFANGGASPLPRVELDSGPKDGVISVDELAEALRPSLGPFRVEVGHQASERTDALFNHLDRNGDGTLTKGELGDAATSLLRLDLDDDGLIGRDELEPFTNPLAMQREEMPGRRGRYAAVPPVIELERDDPSFRPVRLLLKRYDKGNADGSKAGDNLLSRGELAIDPGEFSGADADSDGQLDTEELRRFLERVGPDVEIVVKLSGEASGAATIEASGGGGRPLPASVKAKRLSGGDVEIILGEVHLEFHADDGAGTAAEARRYFQGQFQAADKDNNGYLEKSELNDHGPFAALFDILDRDGDAKLYPKEVDEFVDRQAEAAKDRMVLSASDLGRAIFSILDLDRDRRLGPREVRGTVARVTTWDGDGDGRVSSDEVPHHYQLTIGRARLAGLGMSASPASSHMETSPAPEPAPVGPSWFRRMDRNRDGDVSRREFFGPRAAFDRMDRDHDGLIDPVEAARPRD